MEPTQAPDVDVHSNGHAMPPGPLQTVLTDLRRLFFQNHNGHPTAEPATDLPPNPFATIAYDLANASQRAKQTALILFGVVTFNAAAYYGIPLLPVKAVPPPPPPPVLAAPAAPAPTPAAHVPDPAESALAPVVPMKKVHMRNMTAIVPAIPTMDLQVHHLYGEDYSLNWSDKGSSFTYKIYFANNPKMKKAQLAFFRPVEGTTYRFAIEGDPKNVWMAIAPLDATKQEGPLSHIVHISAAKAEIESHPSAGRGG